MGQVIPITAARHSRPFCPQCGAETDLPEFGVEAPCLVCTPPGTEQPSAPPKEQRAGVIVIGKAALHAVEQLLTATESGVTRIIKEIHALEKQIATLFAFLPVMGAWRIWESEYHTFAEKLRLSSLSASITLVAAFALVAVLLPTASYYSQQTLRRLDGDIRELRDVAEQYRTLHDHYPDEAAWRRFAARADPRFFDPWCRPYRFEAGEDTGISIGSLGRDGVERGYADKADFWLHFPPAVKLAGVK